MQDQSQKLNTKQMAGIAALVQHGDVAKASRAAKVDPSTMHRWMKEPAFALALKEARQLVWTNTLETLKSVSIEAIQTLKKNLRAKRVCDQNTAAKGLLEFSFRATQMLELEERIAAIETLLETQKDKGK